MSDIAIYRQLRISYTKMQLMTVLPDLHDGYFDGLWISQQKSVENNE
jgi:hypothetical protein